MDHTYIIGGKGYYDVDSTGVPRETCIVPNSCTYVVTTIEENKLSENKTLLEYYSEYYGTLLKKDEAMLQHPTQDTMRNTGHTTIYTSGMVCPLVHHTLLLYDDGKVIPTMNGMINISSLYDVGLPEIDVSIHTLTPKECNNKQYITQLYRSDYIFDNDEMSIEYSLNGYIDVNEQSILLKKWEFDSAICHTSEMICNRLQGIFYCFVVKKSPKVYWIGGHGAELIDDSFIVPKGCMIVVKGQSGNVTFGSNTYPMMESLILLPINQLQQPTQYQSIIEPITESIAIYKENTTCPNFNYQLLNCHPSINTCLDMSGVIDISLLQQVPQHNRAHKYNYNMTKTYHTAAVNEFASLFSTSIYPRPSEIQLYYKDYMNYNQEGKKLDGASVYHSLINNKIVNITQKQLCSMYPGVYYNFVCRSINNNTVSRTLPTNTVPTGKNSIPVTPKNTKNKVLHQRVKEAATIRASLQRNQYENHMKKLHTKLQHSIHVHQEEYNTNKEYMIELLNTIFNNINTINALQVESKKNTHKALLDIQQTTNNLLKTLGKNIPDLHNIYMKIRDNLEHINHGRLQLDTPITIPLKNITTNYTRTTNKNGKVKYIGPNYKKGYNNARVFINERNANGSYNYNRYTKKNRKNQSNYEKGFIAAYQSSK